MAPGQPGPLKKRLQPSRATGHRPGRPNVLIFKEKLEISIFLKNVDSNWYLIRHFKMWHRPNKIKQAICLSKTEVVMLRKWQKRRREPEERRRERGSK